MYLFIGLKYQGRRDSDSLNIRAAYRKMPAAEWKWMGVSELGICICDIDISKLECSNYVIETPCPGLHNASKYEKMKNFSPQVWQKHNGN